MHESEDVYSRNQAMLRVYPTPLLLPLEVLFGKTSGKLGRVGQSRCATTVSSVSVLKHPSLFGHLTK